MHRLNEWLKTIGWGAIWTNRVQPALRIPAITLVLFGTLFLSVPAGAEPVVFHLDGANLVRAKEALEQEHPAILAALDHLVERADAALEKGPFSVTHKTITPPSGDKQDYMSFGPYWWPNPDTEDGLPYVRRDGEVNPDARTEGSDSPRLGVMARSVLTLALAHFYTSEDAYAAHAAHLIRTWFLDPDLRMNPHLQYGQAIPGRVEGRGIGIIDTTRLIQVIDAAGLLHKTDFWSDEDHTALQAWFSEYLDWLQTSDHGRNERRTSNNHGTFYDAQVASFALFVGDTDNAKDVLQTAKERRVTSHIKPDGRQPHELERAISFHYSRFNLDAMFMLARFGEHVDLDLWNYSSDETGGIRAAFDYIIPYLDPDEEWPHGRAVTDTERRRVLPQLRQAYRAYGDDLYLEKIQMFPEEELNKDIFRLRFPASLLAERDE